MPDSNDILWFKTTFTPRIEVAVADTPFDVDMLTAIACQETGGIWSVLRKKDLSVDRILELCVGDTLDEDKGRRAFPRTKDALVRAPRGEQMFDIARQALLDMAQFIPGFGFAKTRKNKFCHGFGIFQFDLQFFLTDPDFFLGKRYADFGQCAGKCVQELHNAAKKSGFSGRTSLTDMEMAAVAIAYNTGRFTPSKGLKQGHFDGTRFYGEAFFDFLRQSRTVAVPGAAPATITPPDPGNAAVPPPTPVEAQGPFFEVDTAESPLRLRSEPKIGADSSANVIALLPDGHIVRAVTGKARNGFLEIETSLLGAHLHGFSSQKFLKKAPQATEVVVATPDREPPANGIVAVFMPRRAGTVTLRSAFATAHSLNEEGQPGRKGTTPAALRGEVAAIIDYLAVDVASHKRYQPRSGLTFCNIYAHDYCFLAGVYLPRVWWTPGAIERLTLGSTLEPKIGATIEEMRANALFRWLQDFGPRFGWRRTGTLTKLQQEANQGAIALIVARRNNEGKPGHIVAVVPETQADVARRDTAGDVIAPLQSQAGSRNFRYGTGTRDWWTEDRFAESAFWLHA